MYYNEAGISREEGTRLAEEMRGYMQVMRSLRRGADLERNCTQVLTVGYFGNLHVFKCR